MNIRMIFCLGLITSLAVASISRAQPAIPPAPAGVAAPAAAPPNLWSFLLPNADQKAACKACFCASPLGQMFNGMVGPLSMMSGGMLSGKCSCTQQSLLAGLQQPADSPDGAAARIKADEAGAAERRANVRYLGTVDCNYWPEAVDALKNALRKDRNECVRYEAALALGRGCCCNKEIVDALTNCVKGDSHTDKAPPEHSDRVRAAAAEALARCPIADPTEIEKNKMKTERKPESIDYEKKLAQMPYSEVAANARAVLASLQKGAKTDGSTQALPVVAPIAPRGGGLSGIFANAISPPASTSPAGAANPGMTPARQPFFAGLTKALTGKQDTVVITQKEVVAPMPNNGVVRIPDSRASAPPAAFMAPPAKVENFAPGKLRDIKAVEPIEIVPPMPAPMNETPSSRLNLSEIKAGVSIEILPPTPINATPSSRPSQSEIKAVVPIEITAPTPISDVPSGRPGWSDAKTGVSIRILPPEPMQESQPSQANPNEIKSVAPFGMSAPVPMPTPLNDSTSSRPQMAPMQIIQTAPNAEFLPRGPRQSTGTVALEIVAPRTGPTIGVLDIPAPRP